MNLLKKTYWIIKYKFHNTKISFKTYIKNIHGIKIGNHCKVYRYCELDASNNGKIILKDNVTLNPYSFIQADNNGYIYIDEGTKINNYTIINSGGKIIIGKDVLIGPRVNLIAYSHNHDDINIPIKKQSSARKDIIIEDNVWIGSNCTVLMGVKIGKGAIIGANSLVNRDIEPNSINVGTPCRKIKDRKK